ncbi:hypothetical protein D3C86_1561430 [compost metagenome]
MVTSAGRLRNSTSSGSNSALASAERPIHTPSSAPSSMARTKLTSTRRRVTPRCCCSSPLCSDCHSESSTALGEGSKGVSSSAAIAAHSATARGSMIQ